MLLNEFNVFLSSDESGKVFLFFNQREVQNIYCDKEERYCQCSQEYINIKLNIKQDLTSQT
jgi:hypothetical protein